MYTQHGAAHVHVSVYTVNYCRAGSKATNRVAQRLSICNATGRQLLQNIFPVGGILLPCTCSALCH